MIELDYPKRLVNFTKIFPIVSSVIVLATLYKMEIYELTCSTRFVFFPLSITSPLTLLTLLIIVIASFTVFKYESKGSEIMILICSLLGFPSIFLTNIDPIKLLCGPYKTIFLPSIYLLVLIYAVMLGLSIYLLVVKNRFQKTTPIPEKK
ncbi:MAG TPA: hypothetical protein VMZ29_02940 [Candidatus Bathyarchaeia archaeon]|nr:hypothetical protein [Candidatus Bathyarchaeia archaeon]